MNNEIQPPLPPPVAGLAGTKPQRSKVPTILGVVVALLLVRWMFSGPSKTADSSSSSASAEVPAAAAGGNPVLGEWNLVNPADTAYCPTYQKFTSSQSTYTQDGKTYKQKPIYDIKPGVTIVGYGGSYMGEWRPTGPDDMTLGQVGPPPYGVPTFCKYHRQ